MALGNGPLTGLALGAVGTQSTSSAGDPLWRYVTALYLLNGNLLDSSPYGAHLTNNGVVFNSDYVPGSGLSQCASSGSTASAGTAVGYGNNANSIAMNTGTGDLTIECWAKPLGNQSANTACDLLGSYYSSGAKYAIQIIAGNSINSTYNGIVGGASSSGNSSVVQEDLNLWQHYAFCRQQANSLWYFYKNGVLVSSNALILTPLINSGGMCLFAQDNEFGQSAGTFQGQLQLARVTQYCRYPNGTSFSPPTSMPTHG